MAELARVLIVDDEPLARAGLRQMLATDRAVTVVGEAASAADARDAIARLSPDIVLLDVEMPAEDGFAAVAPDDELPVFVTAHAVHAVRAFEVRALDYVLKPFSDRRFAEAMVRAKAAVALRRPQRITVRDAGRLRYIAYDEIEWIAAATPRSSLPTTRSRGSRLAYAISKPWWRRSRRSPGSTRIVPR
jgi:two-component system, LytTR family, response regulator